MSENSKGEGEGEGTITSPSSGSGPAEATGVQRPPPAGRAQPQQYHSQFTPPGVGEGGRGEFRPPPRTQSAPPTNTFPDNPGPKIMPQRRPQNAPAPYSSQMSSPYPADPGASPLSFSQSPSPPVMYHPSNSWGMSVPMTAPPVPYRPPQPTQSSTIAPRTRKALPIINPKSQKEVIVSEKEVQAAKDRAAARVVADKKTESLDSEKNIDSEKNKEVSVEEEEALKEKVESQVEADASKKEVEADKDSVASSEVFDEKSKDETSPQEDESEKEKLVDSKESVEEALVEKDERLVAGAEVMKEVVAEVIESQKDAVKEVVAEVIESQKDAMKDVVAEVIESQKDAVKEVVAEVIESQKDAMKDVVAEVIESQKDVVPEVLESPPRTLQDEEVTKTEPVVEESKDEVTGEGTVNRKESIEGIVEKKESVEREREPSDSVEGFASEKAPEDVKIERSVREEEVTAVVEKEESEELGEDEQQVLETNVRRPEGDEGSDQSVVEDDQKGCSVDVVDERTEKGSESKEDEELEKRVSAEKNVEVGQDEVPERVVCADEREGEEVGPEAEAKNNMKQEEVVELTEQVKQDVMAEDNVCSDSVVVLAPEKREEKSEEDVSKPEIDGSQKQETNMAEGLNEVSFEGSDREDKPMGLPSEDEEEEEWEKRDLDVDLEVDDDESDGISLRPGGSTGAGLSLRPGGGLGTGRMCSSVSSLYSSDGISTDPSGKKVYTRDFLLQFAPFCKSEPQGNLKDSLSNLECAAKKADGTPDGRAGAGAGFGSVRRDNAGRGLFGGFQPPRGRGFNMPLSRSQGALPTPNMPGRVMRGPRNRMGMARSQPAAVSLPAGIKPLEPTEGRWCRTKAVTDEEDIFRKVRNNLNKLTLEKFDVISAKLCAMPINTRELLEGTISLVFETALKDQNFAAMYAQLCDKLSTDLKLPPLTEKKQVKKADGTIVTQDKPMTFRRILLNKCQVEFEQNKWKANKKLSRDNLNEKEIDELKLQEAKSRVTYMGNIIFSGELFVRNLVNEGVMHTCLQQLLNDSTNPSTEDMEALCKLFSTVGKKIDHEKARNYNEVYIKRIKRILKVATLTARIRFMLEELLELRARDWVPRHEKSGPKTLKEIKADDRDSLTNRTQLPSLRSHVDRSSPGAFGLLQSSHSANAPPRAPSPNLRDPREGRTARTHGTATALSDRLAASRSGADEWTMVGSDGRHRSDPTLAPTGYSRRSPEPVGPASRLSGRSPVPGLVSSSGLQKNKGKDVVSVNNLFSALGDEVSEKKGSRRRADDRMKILQRQESGQKRDKARRESIESHGTTPNSVVTSPEPSSPAESVEQASPSSQNPEMDLEFEFDDSKEEELVSKIDTLMNDLMESEDCDDCISSLPDIPLASMDQLIVLCTRWLFENPMDQQVNICADFLVACHQQQIISHEEFVKGFDDLAVVDVISESLVDCPLLPSVIGTLLGRCIVEGAVDMGILLKLLIPLREVGLKEDSKKEADSSESKLSHTQKYGLGAECLIKTLRVYVALKSIQRLRTAFNTAGLNRELKNFFKPGTSNEAVLNFLMEEKLDLFPLQRCKRAMRDMLTTPSCSAVITWLKKNVESEDYGADLCSHIFGLLLKHSHEVEFLQEFEPAVRLAMGESHSDDSCSLALLSQAQHFCQAKSYPSGLLSDLCFFLCKTTDLVPLTTARLWKTQEFEEYATPFLQWLENERRSSDGE